MGMNREKFEDLMLTDQETFESYAKQFMDIQGTQLQGFLDWCWVKYLDGSQPSPHSTGLVLTFIRTGLALLVFPGLRLL